MKEMEMLEAIQKLGDLPMDEVSALLHRGTDWELISNAIADVILLQPLIPHDTFEIGMIGIVQAAYYLGYKMGKVEGSMPVFMVGEE